MSTDTPPFILGSASPRRKDLLAGAGYRFEVKPSHAEEPEPVGFPSPEAYVTHVAWLKAHAVEATDDRWILGADTAVAVESDILGKAIDRADAGRILRRLRGTRHIVVTGVCLRIPAQRVSLVCCETTSLIMKALSDSEIEDYLATGLWEGKAGAYGIQDSDDPFVQTIEGSFTNVVGLPMERVAEMLRAARNLSP